MKIVRNLLRKIILSIGAVCDFFLISLLLTWIVVYLLKSYVQKRLTGVSSTLDIRRGFESARRMGEIIEPGYGRGRREYTEPTRPPESTVVIDDCDFG